MNKLVAESFGTFALVFAGTGAIVINDASQGAITHVGVALTFGLIVLTMIYALGDVSGCHINPAVTLGLFAAKRFPGRLVGPYIVSQLVGAVAASGVLRLLFPTHATLGATMPAGSALQSFILEFLLTLILMVVILCVTWGDEKASMVGVIVGAVIALEALFAGPICGASMNPARSIAPALVAQQYTHLWVYIAAPIAGALCGKFLCGCLHPGECCQGQCVVRPNPGK